MKVQTQIDEKELLMRLSGGDHAAFDTIYRQYKRQITKKLFLVLKEDELVEDTLQELFYRVWEKRGNIDPGQPIVGYLFRIAANLAHDHFRKMARDQKFAEAMMRHLQNAAPDEYPAEMDAALYRAIDLLPPQRKRVFTLCKLESKSYQEVSELLQISIPAVKDHIVKANRFLKGHYQKTAPLIGYLFATQLLKDIF